MKKNYLPRRESHYTWIECATRVCGLARRKNALRGWTCTNSSPGSRKSRGLGSHGKGLAQPRLRSLHCPLRSFPFRREDIHLLSEHDSASCCCPASLSILEWTPDPMPFLYLPESDPRSHSCREGNRTFWSRCSGIHGGLPASNGSTRVYFRLFPICENGHRTNTCK